MADHDPGTAVSGVVFTLYNVSYTDRGRYDLTVQYGDPDINVHTYLQVIGKVAEDELCVLCPSTGFFFLLCFPLLP